MVINSIVKTTITAMKEGRWGIAISRLLFLLQDGFTCLHLAVMEKHIECVKFLTETVLMDPKVCTLAGPNVSPCESW